MNAQILLLQCFKDAYVIYVLANICILSALNEHKNGQNQSLGTISIYFCYAQLIIDLVLLQGCKCGACIGKHLCILGPQ